MKAIVCVRELPDVSNVHTENVEDCVECLSSAVLLSHLLFQIHRSLPGSELPQGVPWEVWCKGWGQGYHPPPISCTLPAADCTERTTVTPAHTYTAAPPPGARSQGPTSSLSLFPACCRCTPVGNADYVLDKHGAVGYQPSVLARRL